MAAMHAPIRKLVRHFDIYQKIEARSLDQLVRKNVGKGAGEDEGEGAKGDEKAEEKKEEEDQDEGEEKKRVPTKGLKDFYSARFKAYERMRIKSFSVFLYHI